MRADGSPWSMRRKAKGPRQMFQEEAKQQSEQLPKSSNWAGIRKNAVAVDQEMRDKVMEEARRDWNEEKKGWMQSFQSFRSEVMEEIGKLRSEQMALRMQGQLELRDEVKEKTASVEAGYSKVQKRMDTLEAMVKSTCTTVMNEAQFEPALVPLRESVTRVCTTQEKDKRQMEDGLNELRFKYCQLEQLRTEESKKTASLETYIEMLDRVSYDTRTMVEKLNGENGTDESESEGEHIYDGNGKRTFPAKIVKVNKKEKDNDFEKEKGDGRSRNRKHKRPPLRRPA